MGEHSAIDRVTRTRDEARVSYDRLSGSYDLIAGRFEAPHRNVGLQLLAAKEGERVLEIGFGTGACAVALGQAVGASGSVKAIDLSPGMLAIATERVLAADLGGRVELVTGDAGQLPWPDGSFDAVFSSFVLELFDTPELPAILLEWRRVLRPGGRIALVNLVVPEAPTIPTRLYGWAHRNFPSLVDCRPIPARELVEAAGFQIGEVRRTWLTGLPVQSLLATVGSPR